MLTKFGNFFFHYRGVLVLLVLVATVFFVEPVYPAGSRTFDIALDVAGFVIALLGQALRILTIGYDYIRRGGKNKTVYADRLVQGGVFSHSRNPMYVGNILIMLGLTLVLSVPEVYMVYIPLFLFMYAAIIASEENYLRRKFGAEYEDYCRRVNRLWPSWKGFRKSVADISFSWKRVVSKEHGTTYGWLMAAVGFRMYTVHRIEGPDAATEVRFLAGVMVVLTLAYILARVLKKTGRLEEAPTTP